MLAETAYWHGTSGAVIVSPQAVVAAIDSKEVSQTFRNDGTLESAEQFACKVRRAGRFYVLIAGISRATDGFDALQVADGLYREGDTLASYAERLREVLPYRLEPILESLRAGNARAFDQKFRGQDVLQMSVTGVEEGGPRVVVLNFLAAVTHGGEISVEVTRAGCPGDCAMGSAVYLLGVHADAERYDAAHPEQAGDVSTGRALRLIGTEYERHPEVVGGPATVIRADAGGVTMEQNGVCVDDSVLERLENGLDGDIAAVDNVVVHEDVAQRSRHGSAVHSGALHAEVRVVGGSEEYNWSGVAPRHRGTVEKLPEPWCSGELATMPRVTREAMARGLGTLAMDVGEGGAAEIVMQFHATAEEHFWQLVVGARTYALAFNGTAWFSAATGTLTRIRWESTDLQFASGTGIRGIEWDETFRRNEIAGQPFLTPNTAIYRVNYDTNANRTDWTETRFSDYQRYGSSANIQYEAASLR